MNTGRKSGAVSVRTRHTDKVCRKKKERGQNSRCACAQDEGRGGHLKASRDHGHDDSRGPTSEDKNFSQLGLPPLMVQRYSSMKVKMFL